MGGYQMILYYVAQESVCHTGLKQHGTKMNIWVNYAFKRDTLLPKNLTYDSENLKCRLNYIKPL